MPTTSVKSASSFQPLYRSRSGHASAPSSTSTTAHPPNDAPEDLDQPGARRAWDVRRLGAQAVENLAQSRVEDRRLEGGVELARVLEVVEEPVDVELVDRRAQQRTGRKEVVDDAGGDR